MLCAKTKDLPTFKSVVANFRGGNRFGHRALTGHHENPTECKLPSFEDSSEVKFSFDECQRLGNENYPVCTGRGT